MHATWKFLLKGYIFKGVNFRNSQEDVSGFIAVYYLI